MGASIRSRLTLTYLLVLLVFTGFTGMVFLPRALQQGRTAVEQALTQQTALIFDFIARFSATRADLAGSCRAFVQEHGLPAGIRLQSFNFQGKMVVDSGKPSLAGEGDAGQQTMLALSPGAKAALWIVTESGVRFVHVAAPLRIHAEPAGALELTQSLAEVDAASADLVKWFILAVLLAGLAAFAAAGYFAGTLAQPIAAIRDAAAAIARGRLDSRSAVPGQDELAQLSSTLNQMAETLQAQFDQITQERNKLTALISAMVDGVVAADLSGRVQVLNAAAARALRLPASGAVGRPLAEVLGALPALGVYEDSISQDAVVEQEVISGAQAFSVVAVPFVDEDGARIGTLVILRETTALRRLEEVRAQFVSSVSHELRTPLTIIKGFVVNLLDTPGLPAEAHRPLDQVNHEADRLARLVDDLLELSRLRSGAFSLRLAWCDVAELMAVTATQLAPQAERCGVRLEVEPGPAPPPVLMDSDRIRQVLINLVDNGLKFTPAGGLVTVSATASDSELVLSVQDTGPGVAADEVPYLFERFFRSQAQIRQVHGTGLGLAIVKEIVEAHGGRIEVVSQVGQGTTFHCRFPRQHIEAPGTAEVADDGDHR